MKKKKHVRCYEMSQKLDKSIKNRYAYQRFDHAMCNHASQVTMRTLRPDPKYY